MSFAVIWGCFEVGDWFCLDCLQRGEIDKHGRCGTCGSNAVAESEGRGNAENQKYERPQNEKWDADNPAVDMPRKGLRLLRKASGARRLFSPPQAPDGQIHIGCDSARGRPAQGIEIAAQSKRPAVDG